MTKLNLLPAPTGPLPKDQARGLRWEYQQWRRKRGLEPSATFELLETPYYTFVNQAETFPAFWPTGTGSRRSRSRER